MQNIKIETRKRLVKKVKTDELEGIKRLLNLYPSGILSMVSDTYDLWRMCTEYLPVLKKQVLARDGKLVLRPDSGDPVDILCGLNKKPGTWNKIENGKYYHSTSGFVDDLVQYEVSEGEYKGVIELLWNVFGGTVNELGYKVLDSHIGAIYGDAINYDRANQICERLAAKGFASTNWVGGFGSYTYQYNTRDTFGMAIKATYGEVTMADGAIDTREIWKDPITDDGTKRSAKGLLKVYRERGAHGYSNLRLKDQCTKEEEDEGELTTVFLDGMLVKSTNLEQIRNKIKHGA